MTKLIQLVTEKNNSEAELEEVRFDPIPIGEDDTKTIYADNVTNQTVHIEPEVDNVSGSGTVELVSYDDSIESGESGEITLRAKAINAEQLSGITANVTVDATAVIPPNQKL